MTQAAIQEQVNVLKAVTQTATRSKEVAERFLVAAGIIEPEQKANQKEEVVVCKPTI